MPDYLSLALSSYSSFVGKAWRLPLSGAPEMASPSKIRLGWKGLPGTNFLAYYKH